MAIITELELSHLGTNVKIRLQLLRVWSLPSLHTDTLVTVLRGS